MLSDNINNTHQQLTLDFEPGLLDRYKSLRECSAACIYRAGLSNVAVSLNKAPGNLSVELGGDSESKRHFSCDSLESFLDEYKDFTPIYYLIAKFVAKSGGAEAVARDQAIAALKDLGSLLKKAGLA